MSGSWRQLGRRDFLAGAGGGVAAGLGAWFAGPDRWHESRLPFGTNLSYSQCGEDLVAESLFKLLDVARPSYLDIGAYEPILCNNTYRFYRAGGRGVLVEPNVALIPALRKERPGDAVLNVGVGISDQAEADYYVMNLPQRNTFDPDEVKKVEEESKGKVHVERVVKMPLVNVNKIVADHFGGAAPDFLSIDVEGLDVAILKTFDFDRHRPAIVCAEHSQVPTERDELVALLTGKGYAVRGQTYPNTLFVDKKRLS